MVIRYFDKRLTLGGGRAVTPAIFAAAFLGSMPIAMAQQSCEEIRNSIVETEQTRWSVQNSAANDEKLILSLSLSRPSTDKKDLSELDRRMNGARTRLAEANARLALINQRIENQEGEYTRCLTERGRAADAKDTPGWTELPPLTPEELKEAQRGSSPGWVNLPPLSPEELKEAQGGGAPAPAPLPPVNVGGFTPASMPPSGGGELPKVWCVIYREIPGMTPGPHREWSVALPKDIPWLEGVWQSVECNLTFPEAHKKRTELAGGPVAPLPPVALGPVGGGSPAPLPPIALGPPLVGPGGYQPPSPGMLPPDGGDVLPPINVNVPATPPTTGSTPPTGGRCLPGFVYLTCEAKTTSWILPGRGHSYGGCWGSVEAARLKANDFWGGDKSLTCAVDGKPLPQTTADNCPAGTVKVSCATNLSQTDGAWDGKGTGVNGCYGSSAAQEVAKSYIDTTKYDTKKMQCTVAGKPFAALALVTPEPKKKKPKPRVVRHRPPTDADTGAGGGLSPQAAGALIGIGIGLAGAGGGWHHGGGYHGGGGGAPMGGHHR